jgi:hypothetical protein
MDSSTNRPGAGSERLKELIRKGTNLGTAPSDLVDILSELAGLSFFLGEQTAKAHAEYIRAEHTRKMAAALCKHMAIIEGQPIGKAEAQAEKDSSDQRLKEVEAHAEWYRLRVMRDDVAAVMDAIRTKISYLKHERTNS